MANGWNELSNYYFSSLALGLVGSILPAILSKPESKFANWMRGASIALNVLVVILAAVTVFGLAVVIDGNGTLVEQSIHDAECNARASGHARLLRKASRDGAMAR